MGFTHPNPHHGMPSAATFAVISLYGLSGAVNVVLLLFMRPNSPLFGKDECVMMQGGLGRGPELPPVEDGERGGVEYSEFRVRVRAASRGSASASRKGTWRSGDSSRLELGRLPSGGDAGGWHLLRKVAAQRPQRILVRLPLLPRCMCMQRLLLRRRVLRLHAMQSVVVVVEQRQSS
ncbi:hypothetical protein B0H14DRAFT_3499179 [Mycena olivaceomarginata]|nr:hypothetical protein B0H14DRAFT_3499179 [Mycena olivaceomarginata]